MGKIPILTNIFQMGWNHQLVMYFEFQFFFIDTLTFDYDVFCFIWNAVIVSNNVEHVLRSGSSVYFMFVIFIM